ncbi:MAG: Asp-tRNA(Asn)/Glu-tRNA(Gln) amidotransferase subunit GatB [Deltaproteobacteria bacterium]|nr:Asp-tRNA(Asn)/Glu-tRNA(Gln) amidotransferase subunit GatB [Deltaproteobacteria bacterium]
MEFEVVIGLEVHCQLLTETKIFCGCATRFGAAPNTQTCPVCLGMPGVLPVLNKQVVACALKTALATNCRINSSNRFARKNYFYPDLPKGYQISQFELPIAEHGHLDIEVDGQQRTIGITRIHMEEDAGKLMHELDGVSGDASYVDLNRTGVPLIEIVSEPDMRSPEEAGAYLRSLRSIVQYLEVCDGNMEQGSFRCDANISLRPVGQQQFGTKVELKNMNSFRHVERGIAYEIMRQRDLLEDGETIIQETRLWNEGSGETCSMRGKEEAHDYRYFPDPDLVPIEIDEAWTAGLHRDLPELPSQKLQRFLADYSLPRDDADRLVGTRQLADYFEQTVALLNQPKTISNWVLGDILRTVNDTRRIGSFAVTPQHLAAMLTLIDKGTINGKIAKTVFDEMAASGKMPDVIVEENGLVQVSDTGALEQAVDKVITANPDKVAQYRSGKDKLFGFFMGQVMKATKGKANPGVVTDILRKKLTDE